MTDRDSTVKKTNWRAIAELVAVLSVVLSLIFVGYELRLNRANSVSENLANVADRVLAFRQAVAENAEAWHKGCLGEEMTGVERIQFFSLLQMYDFRLFASYQNALSGTGERDPEDLARSVARNMVWFPAFREAYLLHAQPVQNDQTNSWQVAIEEQYAILSASDMPRVADVGLCGR